MRARPAGLFAFLEIIMPRFTIETTYRLPVYRQRTYDAETLEGACRLAIDDDDWSEQKEDYESSGETYVTDAWPGEDTAYRVAALPLPSQFAETLQRKADHFETLLGILKVLAHAQEAGSSDRHFGVSALMPRSPKPRRFSPAPPIRISREPGHERIHRQDRVLAARL
jgi:hypothetical protein